MTEFGAPPRPVRGFDLRETFVEVMHYMYLPVLMPGTEVRLPERLNFARPLIEVATTNFRSTTGNEPLYVYLTARRGYATPGNPLNRPGWHTDGFGTDDVNYVWTDSFPTLFACHEFEGICPMDHVRSLAQFEEQARVTDLAPLGYLVRLDQYVVHSAPEIPAPGGMRSFIKISFSGDRYNLVGNSHNYLFDYDWKMYPRNVVRNDPARAGGDAGPQ